MRLPVVCILFAALTVSAQNPDPVGQKLLNQAQLDQNAFGAGNSASRSPNLEATVLRSQSDLTVQSIDDPLLSPEEDPALAGTQTAAEMFLRASFSHSDIAVIGTVSRQVSVFNSTKRGIVTEALINVQEVLYSKTGNSVADHNDIYVARPGGTVIVGGHKVSVVDPTFPAFSTGSKYVLFLKLDARTNSYRVENSDAFELSGTQVKSVNPTKPHPAHAFMNSSEGFVTTVRNRAREVQK